MEGLLTLMLRYDGKKWVLNNLATGKTNRDVVKAHVY
jgi:hypothetical protein